MIPRVNLVKRSGHGPDLLTLGNTIIEYAFLIIVLLYFCVHQIQFMKKFSITLLLSFMTMIAMAQSAEKTTRYCSVLAQGKLMSKKFNIRLDLGETPDLTKFKDPNIKSLLYQVEEYANVADALNFMAVMGWHLVSTTGMNSSGTTVGYNFFFRKEFDKEALDTK